MKRKQRLTKAEGLLVDLLKQDRAIIGLIEEKRKLRSQVALLETRCANLEAELKQTRKVLHDYQEHEYGAGQLGNLGRLTKKDLDTCGRCGKPAPDGVFGLNRWLCRNCAVICGRNG